MLFYWKKNHKPGTLRHYRVDNNSDRSAHYFLYLLVVYALSLAIITLNKLLFRLFVSSTSVCVCVCSAFLLVISKVYAALILCIYIIILFVLSSIVLDITSLLFLCMIVVGLHSLYYYNTYANL